MSNLLQFKTYKSKRYTHVDLTSVEDKRLSWKAKGIHLYLMSRPEEWKIRTLDLENRATDGSTSFQSGLKELSTLGYVYKANKKDKRTKRIKAWLYLVFETPKSQKEVEESLPDECSLFIKKPTMKRTKKARSQNPKTQSLETHTLEELETGKPGGIIINNSNNDNSTNDNLDLSKDKLIGSEEPIKTISAKKNKYIDYFCSLLEKNNIKSSAKHKDPSTDVYQKAAEKFTQLENGIFGSGKKFDQKTIKMNNINNALLNGHKWTSKEIRQGLNNLLLYLTEGYWPPNKKSLQQTNLHNLLYNAWSKKSMFLNAYCNPPKLLGDLQTVKDPNPEITQIFLNLLETNIGDKLDRSDKINLIKTTQKLIITHENIDFSSAYYPQQVYYKLGRPGYPITFCEMYAKWLDNRFNENLTSPWMIGPDSKSWNEFKRYIYEELEVSI